ncbi:MAG TPA: sigma-70 family RNA polymerase sigma factor [Gemmatimonadaceae bacterium]
MSSPSDRELIAAAAQGQVAAFATLLGRYRDVRTRFALRMLGNYDSADEALQAAFVRAFQSIARCRNPEQFGDWLFRIVINECRARALRRTVRARNTGEFDAIADWRAAVEGSEHGADIQRALDQIDPINREAFILQYVEELPYPQIASLTGASVITLERQVDRACSRLRELLPDRQNEPPKSAPSLSAAIDPVGPSFAVRIAVPLRRAEVLNDSFEDRLMAKLLRPGEAQESAASPAATAPSEPGAAPVAVGAPPPSPATLPDPPFFGGRIALLPRQWIYPAIAIGLTLVAFGAGYAVRGHSTARTRAVVADKTSPGSSKLVRRTDTVRVVKSDTMLVARFVFSESNAKSVDLAGDFNRWDPSATSLTRMPNGSWSRSLRLAPGRYEYAFLVDGKRWAADRFARSSHDAFDIESSVIDLTASSPVTRDDASAASRLKKLLPRVTAERVLDTIAVARAHGLPSTALENRALKYAVRHVAPHEIEDAIAADADAMTKSSVLLAAATQRDPSGAEIDAAAQLIGEGVDSTSIAALAKAAAPHRSLEVPLRVSGELVATSIGATDALSRVAARLRDGATDSQLSHLLDDASATLAGKGKKPPVVAKSSTSNATVRQAGSPAKAHPATKPRHKTNDK